MTTGRDDWREDVVLLAEIALEDRLCEFICGLVEEFACEEVMACCVNC